jgi:hypothetical protein
MGDQYRNPVSDRDFSGANIAEFRAVIASEVDSSQKPIDRLGGWLLGS